MLNLVELGTRGDPGRRLAELGRSIMDVVELGFEAVSTDSEIYGASIDLVVDDLEIASGVAGPHALDEKWGISEPWVGWGFGIERMAMVLEGSSQIHRFGRSLAYLDGSRLNIQRTSGSSPKV